MKRASFRYLTKLQKQVLIPPFTFPWWHPPSAQLHSASNLTYTCKLSNLLRKVELTVSPNIYVPIQRRL